MCRARFDEREGEGREEKRRARKKTSARKRNELAEKTGLSRRLKAGRSASEETINPRFVEIESRLIGARVELTAPDQIMSLVPTLY